MEPRPHRSLNMVVEFESRNVAESILLTSCDGCDGVVTDP